MPFSEVVLNKGDILACEITTNAKSVPQKIYQLERAERLRKSCMPGVERPKAMLVIVNGPRSRAERIVLH